MMEPTFDAKNLGIIASATPAILIPDLSIYPNPATDLLHISISGDKEHRVSLSNIYGQVLDQWSIHETGSLNISSLSPGIYLINVDGLISKKFIKR